MNSIRILAPLVCRYGVQHFSYDRLANPKPHVLQDFLDSNITIDEIKTKTVLLDFRSEGQCDQIIQSLVDCVTQMVDRSPVVIFNSVIKNKSLNYKYFCMPAWMTNHCEWFVAEQYQQLDCSVNTKFLCLMRRPSMYRARLASQLLEAISSLRLSFGSMCKSNQLESYKNLFPTVNLPITLDGLVDQHQQHNSAQELFSTCLFNVVVETSSQSDKWSWRSQFITEKTFKAFALKQIPVWWAVPGLVQEVKNLGFDLFDDIVNHNYNAITNEEQRLNALVNQIKLIDKTYTVAECNYLRKSICTRLENNFDLVLKLYRQQNRVFEDIVKQIDEN